jgi:periplasmic divalent cation tolerance protein
MEYDQRVVILITTGTYEEANQIAEVLLEKRKAACINIIPEVRSRFWWEGHLHSDQENLLIVKAKASLLDEIVGLVKEVHSCDVPEVIALPIIGGSSDYLEWIGKELQERGDYKC